MVMEKPLKSTAMELKACVRAREEREMIEGGMTTGCDSGERRGRDLLYWGDLD